MQVHKIHKASGLYPACKKLSLHIIALQHKIFFNSTSSTLFNVFLIEMKEGKDPITFK